MAKSVEIMPLLSEDWVRNAGNTKGRFICVSLRLASMARRQTELGFLGRIIGVPFFFSTSSLLGG